MLLAVLLVIVAFLALLLAGMSIYILAAFRNVVPAVFTPGESLDRIVSELDLPEHGKIVDLGCGDGRVLAAVLRYRPELEAVGVENNPVVLGLAKVRLKGRAELRRGDLLKYDLKGCDRVFAYLGPEMMERLEPRMERELRPGARLVSQQFPLPYRKPDQVVELPGAKSYARRLYVYDY